MWEFLKSVFSNNDELDSSLLVLAAMFMWFLHGVAVAFIPGFAASAHSTTMGTFIDDIVKMVFVYKFTKSNPLAGIKDKLNGKTD